MKFIITFLFAAAVALQAAPQTTDGRRWNLPPNTFEVEGATVPDSIRGAVSQEEWSTFVQFRESVSRDSEVETRTAEYDSAVDAFNGLPRDTVLGSHEYKAAYKKCADTALALSLVWNKRMHADKAIAALVVKINLARHAAEVRSEVSLPQSVLFKRAADAEAHKQLTEAVRLYRLAAKRDSSSNLGLKALDRAAACEATMRAEDADLRQRLKNLNGR